MKFEMSELPGTPEAKIIQDRLKEHNHKNIAPDTHRDLVLFKKSDSGQVLAGLVGSTNWGWLYIRLLWVDDSLRGQGVGKSLIRTAEEIARSRRCNHSWIDTFNPVALRSYQELGYIVFGQMEDFPPGKVRYFLKKII